MHELGLRHLFPHRNEGQLYDVNISNSGRFELARDYGPLRLNELYMLSSQHVVGSTLQLAVVSLQRELFVAFSWANPLLSQGQVDRIRATLLDTLEHASRSNSLGPRPTSGRI